MGQRVSEYHRIAGHKGVYEKRLTGKYRGEVVYAISYRDSGKKQHFEVVGRKRRDGMSPAEAEGKRADKIMGKIPTAKAMREGTRDQWDMDRLWLDYDKARVDRAVRMSDIGLIQDLPSTACWQATP